MFGKGPRTQETKTDASEFWRPLKLCVGTIIAGWAALGLLTLAAFLNRETTNFYAWFFERQMCYGTLYVGWAILRIRALIARWGRETSDEDYTSLQIDNHLLKGIIPLTASTRWLFVVFGIIDRYILRKGKPDDKPDKPGIFNYNYFGSGGAGGAASVGSGKDSEQPGAGSRSGVGKLHPK